MMSSHLNASLETRFVRALFFPFALLLLTASTHASEGPATHVGVVGDGSVAAPAQAQVKGELRALMSGSDEAQADRRPGFSPIIYAPEPQDPRAEIAAQLPTTRLGIRLQDSISVQPPEAVTE